MLTISFLISCTINVDGLCNHLAGLRNKVAQEASVVFGSDVLKRREVFGSRLQHCKEDFLELHRFFFFAFRHVLQVLE